MDKWTALFLSAFAIVMLTFVTLGKCTSPANAFEYTKTPSPTTHVITLSHGDIRQAMAEWLLNHHQILLPSQHDFYWLSDNLVPSVRYSWESTDRPTPLHEHGNSAYRRYCQSMLEEFPLTDPMQCPTP